MLLFRKEIEGEGYESKLAEDLIPQIGKMKKAMTRSNTLSLATTKRKDVLSLEKNNQ